VCRVIVDDACEIFFLVRDIFFVYGVRRELLWSVEIELCCDLCEMWSYVVRIYIYIYIWCVRVVVSGGSVWW
jgi:hypothetical protein